MFTFTSFYAIMPRSLLCLLLVARAHTHFNAAPPSPLSSHFILYGLPTFPLACHHTSNFPWRRFSPTLFPATGFAAQRVLWSPPTETHDSFPSHFSFHITPMDTCYVQCLCDPLVVIPYEPLPQIHPFHNLRTHVPTCLPPHFQFALEHQCIFSSG